MELVVGEPARSVVCVACEEEKKIEKGKKYIYIRDNTEKSINAIWLIVGKFVTPVVERRKNFRFCNEKNAAGRRRVDKGEILINV